MPEINRNIPSRDEDFIEIDLRDVFRTLVKHRYLFIGVLCLTVAGAHAYNARTRPVYQAQSRILVDRRPPKIVKVEEVVLPEYSDANNFFNSQVEILKSRTLAGMVFDELGGYEPPARRGKPAKELKDITAGQRLNSLLENVKISPVRNTQIIDVNVEDTDPKLATRIANTWAQSYVLFSSVDQLIQKRSELETDLYQRAKYLKDKHPVILGLQSEIAAIDERIAGERAKLSRQDGQDSDISSWSGNVTNVKIIDRAQVPQKPVRPRKMLNYALAVIFGLFAGGMLVVIFESLDQTIKTAPDLEKTINMSSIVAIPYFKNKKAPAGLIPELVSEKSPHSLVTESFRHLRTGIIYSNPDFSKRTMLVTSSSALEGKTTTAINLATVFAQSGERTLLVDTDMRSPRLHTIFNIERVNGLTDILVHDKEDIHAFTHKTDIPNLDVLACGEIPPNPSELLDSQKMQDFILRACQDYQRVIFDSPPLLAATDAAILSAKADATILVVRAGFAHRQAVMSSVKALKTVNARILTVVLNMVNFYGDGHHYYGYSLYEPNTRRKIAARGKGREPKIRLGKKKEAV